MLPTRASAERHAHAGESVKVKPGSWWRLADPSHAISEMPAPEHGLIMMVQEVRIIDGDLHTIVLHPHPTWGSARPKGGLKLMAEAFLSAFAPAPDGEALREAEIAHTMGQVQAISEQMKTPPDAAKLLQAPGEAGDRTTGNDDGACPDSLPESFSRVPAALLPSGDVIAAQKDAETRLAAFTAQKDWITARTEELKSTMNVVSAYQMEKVNATMASISEETSRAEELLKNVQTMRLFLGEDMSVTPLLDGPGAPASEPLTFMQRMLFLDEEIFVNSLLEGLNADHMDPATLSDLFSADFSLVERMLPTPRCAAIVRVRRNSRPMRGEITDVLSLFQAIEAAEADKRVHILIRDGARLSMVTADATTSGAERFFPSRAEIDALFSTRSFHENEGREILPDTVEYSDARAAHDDRARFYKRFLILLWGIHERTDAFGPFMARGTNWLAETTHSDHFRFIHDEEDALTDGRPDIRTYIDALNADLAAGSRIVAKWGDVFDGGNAPAICSLEKDRVSMKSGVALAEDISVAHVEADGSGMLATRAPAMRLHWRKPNRPFNAKVTVSRPRTLREGRPDDIPGRECSDGLICIDRCRLEDLAYYINSRAARKDYLNSAHMLNRAYTLLVEEREAALALHAEIAGPDTAKADFLEALHLWRSGHKWAWPETSTHRNAVLKIAALLSDRAAITARIAREASVLRGGLTAKGQVFVLTDTSRAALSDGTPLPWIEEKRLTGPRARQAQPAGLRDWHGGDRPGEMILFTDSRAESALLDRCAPGKTITPHAVFRRDPETIRAWRTPRGLFSARNATSLDTIASGTNTVARLDALIAGDAPDDLLALLADTYREKRTPNGFVEKPVLRASLALVTTLDAYDVPRAWIIEAQMAVDSFACRMGHHADVKALVARTYRAPDKVFPGIRDARHPLVLTASRLTMKHPLHARWLSAPELLFAPGSVDLTSQKGLCEPIPDLSWRHIIGTLFNRPDKTGKTKSGFATRVHSHAQLAAAAAGLHVTAASGAEDLMDRIFADSD